MTTNPIHVVHSVSRLGVSAGGPSRSVVGLAENLAKEPTLNVMLITQRIGDENIISPRIGGDDFRVVQTSSTLIAKSGILFANRLNALLGQCQGATIVHGHGIWDAVSFWTGLLAKHRGRQFVLHPRGMLDSWCLAYKPFKKKLAMSLYQRRCMESVDLFVATSEQELESIRRLGFFQPVAVIPNGIEFESIELPPDKKKFNARKVLFLSRIHEVKGLINLVRAWASVSPPGWKLIIAGPDEGGYWRKVEREISELRIHDRVSYVGPVEGEAKSRLYRESELFVLPSFSENFGIVVAEALSHGLPVITTKGTPWDGLLKRGCGWWIEPTVEALEVALKEALLLSRHELQLMSTSAKAFAAEFQWPAIAEQMVGVYQWLVGSGERPDCVRIDK